MRRAFDVPCGYSHGTPATPHRTQRWLLLMPTSLITAAIVAFLLSGGSAASAGSGSAESAVGSPSPSAAPVGSGAAYTSPLELLLTSADLPAEFGTTADIREQAADAAGYPSYRFFVGSSQVQVPMPNGLPPATIPAYSVRSSLWILDHPPSVVAPQRPGATSVALGTTIGDYSAAWIFEQQSVKDSAGNYTVPQTISSVWFALGNTMAQVDLYTAPSSPSPFNISMAGSLARRQAAIMRSKGVGLVAATSSPATSPVPTALVVQAELPRTNAATRSGLDQLRSPTDRPNPIEFYDRIPMPRDISLAVPVVVSNVAFAGLLAVALALSSALLNAALHEFSLSPGSTGRRRLPAFVTGVLLVLALASVPTLLNVGIDLRSDAGRVVLAGDVATGIVLAALLGMSRIAFHFGTKQQMPGVELFVPGLIVAGLLIVGSRLGDLHPGLAYTSFGGVAAIAALRDQDRAWLHLTELWLPFLVGFCAWMLLLTPMAAIPIYALIALTLFFIVAWHLLFGSLPLALTEGWDVWTWQRRIAVANLMIVNYVFMQTLVNPSNTFIAAVQSQRSSGFFVVVAVFLTGAALLYLAAVLVARKRGKRVPTLFTEISP